MYCMTRVVVAPDSGVAGLKVIYFVFSAVVRVLNEYSKIS